MKIVKINPSLKKISSLILGILGIIVLFYFCFLRGKTLYNETYNIKRIDDSRYEDMRQTILGKYISSLSQIILIQNKITNTNYFIYLYSTSGCGNCIKKGFGLVHKIDSTLGKTFVKVICEGCGKVTNNKLYYNYNEYVYADEKKLICQELKYIHTPVFLILNKHYKILFAHFFTPSDNNVLINKLMDSIRAKYHTIQMNQL